MIQHPNVLRGGSTVISLSKEEEKRWIDKIVEKADKVLDAVISNPPDNTTRERWIETRNKYSQNISGLSVAERCVSAFAYTTNKGEEIRLSLTDEKGRLD